MNDHENESAEERIEQDAYALAQLIYDIYREKQRNDSDIYVTR